MVSKEGYIFLEFLQFFSKTLSDFCDGFDEEYRHIVVPPLKKNPKSCLTIPQDLLFHNLFTQFIYLRGLDLLKIEYNCSEIAQMKYRNLKDYLKEVKKYPKKFTLCS